MRYMGLVPGMRDRNEPSLKVGLVKVLQLLVLSVLRALVVFLIIWKPWHSRWLISSRKISFADRNSFSLESDFNFTSSSLETNSLNKVFSWQSKTHFFVLRHFNVVIYCFLIFATRKVFIIIQARLNSGCRRGYLKKMRRKNREFDTHPSLIKDFN